MIFGQVGISALRALMRNERLSLDELAVARWVVGPWTQQQQRGAYGQEQRSRHADTHHGQPGEHPAGH